MRFTPMLVAVSFALSILSGCESYDFTVNEKVVYSPSPPFSDFEAPDPALHECLTQAIADGKVSNAADLAVLNCSHAGIASLQGLAVFTGLERLKLSANQVSDLSPLQGLAALQELYLDDNRIIDPVPLYHLPGLRTLDLSGNNRMQCPEQSALVVVEELTLPQHCH